MLKKGPFFILSDLAARPPLLQFLIHRPGKIVESLSSVPDLAPHAFMVHAFGGAQISRSRTAFVLCARKTRIRRGLRPLLLDLIFLTVCFVILLRLWLYWVHKRETSGLLCPVSKSQKIRMIQSSLFDRALMRKQNAQIVRKKERAPLPYLLVRFFSFLCSLFLFRSWARGFLPPQ